MLAYNTAPLVSCDFNGASVSSTFDGDLTKVLGKEGKLVKMIAWYDNETGYSARMLDLARHMLTGSWKASCCCGCK